MRIILITGISGSGKSVALNALEDVGYYCVENLRPRFLQDLADELHRDGCTRLAVAIDARPGAVAMAKMEGITARDAGAPSVADINAIITHLRADGHTVRVLFLNASTQALIARYSETRRRHPLSAAGGLPSSPDGVSSVADTSLADAIERERTLVAPLASLGHQIDTSNLRANTLRAWVRTFAEHQNEGLTVMFQSFGFKKGLPLDADYVFDVRMLPNPYYDLALRPLTGLDKPVIDYLNAIPEVHRMIDDIAHFVETWLPAIRGDNRSYLTVAIGCTGGQHRSVFISKTLAERFGGVERVILRHREIAPVYLAGASTGR
ncbi:RNase adapter RapZ [Robbsia andropogonis]|uniref:RNase adapter RapZ n=1 Tax=Robbsia andropogonis TaxID=28092 RepID=UPI000465C200|nr:RNase adapter RapZ [Robbsia andropogonis]MCP1117159.1 RNase adapter RapZ [Robbsia andropogonis]MCP1128505.1 RNase adapter RapZ [Robbsia andropogonis]